MQIPLANSASFTRNEHGRKYPSAANEGEERIIKVNQDYPFEDVRFIASEDDLEDAIKKPAEREVDRATIKAFGAPALIGYGVEAVREVTRRLAVSDPKDAVQKFYLKRCASEVLGESAGIPQLSVDDAEDAIEFMRDDFRTALSHYLEMDCKPSDAAEYLSFMSPLLSVIGMDKSKIIENVEEATDSKVSLPLSRASFGESFPEIVTQNGLTAGVTLRSYAYKLERLGLVSDLSRTDFEASELEIEINALERMAENLPFYALIKRSNITKDIKFAQARLWNG